MAKVTPISEQFQHLLQEMKESFWGDLYGQTRPAWKKYFEAESERLQLDPGWRRAHNYAAPVQANLALRCPRCNCAVRPDSNSPRIATEFAGRPLSSFEVSI